MVARVAAVSPIIRFKNASPFFMVEVEQAEQRQTQHQQHGEDVHAPSDQRSLPEISRSATEISEIFGARKKPPQLPAGVSSGGRMNHEGQGSPEPPGSGSDSAGAAGAEELIARRGNIQFFPHDAGTRVLSDPAGGGCIGEESKPGRTKRAMDERRRESKGDGGGNEGQQKQQLMTKLVLNGRRCISWQAFLVPERTYVFPAVGAIVLGGGRRMYRAFGDAGREAGRVRADEGGAAAAGLGVDRLVSFLELMTSDEFVVLFCGMARC